MIQNEEVKPTVKVMDLQTVQKVNDVQRMVNQYKSIHNQQLPAGEELYPGLYVVDMKLAAQAGSPSITLQSVYSGQELPFIMDEQGTVYVDYAFDIMQALEKQMVHPRMKRLFLITWICVIICSHTLFCTCKICSIYAGE